MMYPQLAVLKRFIRNSLKLITPPIILRLMQRKSKESAKNGTYVGMYSSFAEVISKHGTQADYSTDEQHFTSIQVAQKSISMYNQNHSPEPSWSSQRLNFLPIFLSGLDRDHLKILDVGGGFGETYLGIKRMNKISLEYKIIELTKTVIDARALFNEFSEIQFFSNLDNLAFTPDIVYFGSSLQYFENYSGVLANVIELSPKFIIISDTPIGMINTFVCAQINMKNIVIPRYVFGERDLTELLTKSNYRLIHKSENYYPTHNFKDYAYPYSEIHHINLIFKRLSK